MVRKKTTASSRARRRRHLYMFPLLALFIVAIVVSGFYFLSNKVISKNTIQDVASQLQIPEDIKKNVEPQELQNTSTTSKISSQTDGVIKSPTDTQLLDNQQSQDSTEGSFNQPSETPVPSKPFTPLSQLPQNREMVRKDPSLCQPAAQVSTDFYSHLDKQPYFQNFGIPTSSEAHFKQLIQRLLENPPIVSRETDDLFNILQNTAHFFRIIGKKNISVLKGILDREKPSFEGVLENFYLVTSIPDCAQKELNLAMSQEALYEYAGFFLNTMGGRLYLFRRDSISRLTVNFYAILIVDQANDEENNSYGIELTTPINSLISEIEAANDQLKMKDTYLDVLYDLKVKYQ
jgi:hypothetical protein